MNSTEAIRNYKHDIAGKFKDISTAIKNLDANSFSDSEAREIFYAVHEVILRMVKTSKSIIAQNLNQEIILIVTNDEPDLNMSKIQVEGVNVRYQTDSSTMKYVYSKKENEGEMDVHIGVLKALLPINKVIYQDPLAELIKQTELCSELSHYEL